jgi:hypothetical protein
MFAVYLVVLAGGVVRISEAREIWGWTLVITAASLFGWRLYSVLNQIERKLRFPGDSEKDR